MAILFLLGTIAGFGLSVGTTYQVQDQTPWGSPVGEPRKVVTRSGDRIFFGAFGTVCMAGCLYFVAKIRREDTRN